MSANEWMQSHPEQCEEYVKAWQRKQDRNRSMAASIQYVIAASQGVKINGRNVKYEDFYKDHKPKRSPEVNEQIQQFLAKAQSLKSEKKQVKSSNG